MLDFLRDAVGERLPLDDYVADYDRRFLAAGSHESWKFEREQNFRQPGTPSWDAFARGNWDDALRLIAQQRDDLCKLADEDATRGVTTLRVRVVEEPIVPYVQWELHSLRLRAECGEKIRVIGPGEIVKLEGDGQLPELLTVGTDTVYEILYDATGVLTGAIRYVDRELTQRCIDFIERLYSTGEDIHSYFERVVAHLEPPTVV
jgi:hypothetical protein